MWVESPDSAQKQNEKEKKALKKFKKCNRKFIKFIVPK